MPVRKMKEMKYLLTLPFPQPFILKQKILETPMDSMYEHQPLNTKGDTREAFQAFWFLLKCLS